MARRPSLIKTKKKPTRAAPAVRRGKKLSGPDFTEWNKWTGEKFYKFRTMLSIFIMKTIRKQIYCLKFGDG